MESFKALFFVAFLVFTLWACARNSVSVTPQPAPPLCKSLCVKADGAPSIPILCQAPHTDSAQVGLIATGQCDIEYEVMMTSCDRLPIGPCDGWRQSMVAGDWTWETGGRWQRYLGGKP